MSRYERSGKSKGYSKEDYPKKKSRNRRSFRGNRRDSDRGSRRSRGKLEMTKVTCSDCGEVPFKPTSSKPVYCSDCFEKKGGRSSGNNSSKDLEIINEKLDKIMEALEIE